MAPETQSEILQILESSRQEFHAAASGVSENHAKTSPGEGRWSVLQCVEHVTFVEERFLTRLEQAPRTGAAPANREKEAGLLAQIPDRSTKVQAPEAARPSGRFETFADALEHFHAARSRTVGFAEQHGPALYGIASEHPRFGPMNGTEMLLIMAGHARRHAAQIREIRTALGVSGL